MILHDEVLGIMLEHCRRSWEGGNYPALADAIRHCAEAATPLPKWAVEAVLNELERSQTPAAKKRHLENYIHWIRWDTVREIRDRRTELAYTDAKTGWVDDEIYETVAKILTRENSPAAASAGAIAKSYKKVQRALKSGDQKTFAFTRIRPF